jgi:filamentous hemagglutinin
MGTVSAGPEGIVEHAPSSPTVETAPPRRGAPSAQPEATASPQTEKFGEPTAPRRSTSEEILEVLGEETTGGAPDPESEITAHADDVRDQAHPRTSESTSGPERARAAIEAEESGPHLDDMRGNEAEIGSTVPEERPSDMFVDPAAPTPRAGEPLGRPPLREDTVAAIVDNARTNEHGQFVDHLGNVIEDPHIGHTYGHENRRIVAAGEELGLTQTQLGDYVNARPEFFQIEEGPVNISHANEMPGLEPFDHIVVDMEIFFGL